jgi:adenine-specific DNA-methyltransferase
MSDQPEKLDLASASIPDAQYAKFRELFPEVFTEGRKIDFERLKRTLGETADPGKERFGLTWPGKADCFKTIQQPSTGTLRPIRDQSVNFDSTENLIIEGDNLEVLKLLQKSYLGKVKLIFIDPPYNTGNDFIYPDNYSESLETYLEYTGQVDEQGRRFGANLETDGRFHSKWLNMMYPRLFLARNLLRTDGAIFITIDDSELPNLLHLMNEIFGGDNHIATIAWQKKYSVSNNSKGVASVRDHIVVYAKSSDFSNGLLPRDEEAKARYINPDNDPRGPWKPVDYWNQASPEDRPNLVYEIENPNTKKMVVPGKKAWKFSPEVHQKHVTEKRIWWGADGTNTVPALKLFLSDVRDGMIPNDWWPHEEAGHTDSAKKALDALFDGSAPFDTPKPVKLIERIAQVANLGHGEIALDFFAGSGTTAEAILEYNRKDQGGRKFVLVQLPESTGRKDYRTIADITKERVRRVINKIKAEDTGKLDLAGGISLDLGFRVFQLASSNFKAWDQSVPRTTEKLAEQLDLQVDHIISGRSEEDILIELLLKSGIPLSTKIETLTLAGKKVFALENGAMLVCLDRHLSSEVVIAIANKQPVRVLCLDAGFAGNDQLKTNAVQQMRARGVTKFQTV